MDDSNNPSTDQAPIDPITPAGSKKPLIDVSSTNFQFKQPRKDIVPGVVTGTATIADTAPIPEIEAVVPGTTQTAVIHTLEAAGLVALSFILTTLIGSVGHFDVSHWQPIYQGLWTYALPTIVLGIQSALKMVEAKKETVLAQKTLNVAKSMVKNFSKNTTA